MTACRLPTELIEDIISEFWLSDISPDDRITFMISSMLVDKTWMDLFARISFKDVYVPCASYVSQYCRTLQKRPTIYAKHLPNTFPQQLCRSLTFTPTGASVHPDPSNVADNTVPYHKRTRLGEAIDSTVHDLANYLPNLRRVSIEYSDTHFNQIYSDLRYFSLPKQVTVLELRVASYHLMTIELSSVRHLSVFGASEGLLEALIPAVPKGA